LISYLLITVFKKTSNFINCNRQKNRFRSIFLQVRKIYTISKITKRKPMVIYTGYRLQVIWPRSGYFCQGPKIVAKVRTFLPRSGHFCQGPDIVGPRSGFCPRSGFGARSGLFRTKLWIFVPRSDLCQGAMVPRTFLPTSNLCQGPDLVQGLDTSQ